MTCGLTIAITSIETNHGDALLNMKDLAMQQETERMSELMPQETYQSQVECQSHPVFINFRQPAHHLHNSLAN